ncbi:uncharacterized protein LOC126909544 [Daktulosphaira vitifoliae]|uniref:uncharacterized protein LOC126909544 n=1 Tax=Daktulosphaira vitifoliae TaxID=58002 RepID=UPI0021AA1657|nr:uncharacterized protein LOC126909544 [Daktulosphaira vitifoliae]
MSKLIFSSSDDEILIQEVENNPILYNIAATDYKNIIIKDTIWIEISAKIEQFVDETKKRWKNIRNSYSRNKRKLGTGSAASKKKKWSLATHLTFLDQVECERDSACNVTINHSMDVPCDEENVVDTLCEAANSLPTETLIRKRCISKSKNVADLFVNNSEERSLLIKKIMNQNEKLLEKKEESFDELDLFFKTMAVTVKKLPIKGQLDAKRKIFSLMTELEEKYLLDEQPIHPHAVQQHLQTLHSFQPSPSTSMYSTSSDSQFSMYNYDGPTTA